jgi:hypothetical protein
MSEFLEHGHIEWSDERLFDEVQDVVELLRIPHNETRLVQLRQRLARATFEQMERYAEAHPEAVILENA